MNAHEDYINTICPSGKYLATGTTCRKQDFVTYWEKDNTQKYLNPAACQAASSSFYWPVFLTGFFGFLVFGYACIMLGACFFLSDTSEFMEIYNKKTGLTELAFFALALLLLIICLIFIGKFTTSSTAGYAENAWAAKNRDALKDNIVEDADWKTVHKSVIGGEAVLAKSSIPFNSSTMP
jgi:hypothetical protein